MKVCVISMGRKLSRLSIATICVACLAIFWSRGSTYFRRPICPTHGGFVHPAFQEVKKSFVQNIESGFDKGSSFAVYHNGEPLVDLWGGCADEANVKPWEKDTLSQAWSSTKGITAVLLATLVDKGRLDVNEKVSYYWPEFAQNGKENITVAMLFSHQAGLTQLERRMFLHEYRDNWQALEDMMAEQTPLWEPGKHFLYHALTWGMYADALIRRVDEKHRNASQYFQEEIADKIGDLDFYIGLPQDKFSRSARASYAPMWAFGPQMFGNIYNWVFLPNLVKHFDLIFSSSRIFYFMDDLIQMEDAEMRSIGLPSAGGFGNARSIARIFDFVGNNGMVKDKRLMSPKMADILSTPVNQNATAICIPDFPCSALGTFVEPSRLVRGLVEQYPESSIGHRGYGGQIGYADLKSGLGVGYVTNYDETFGMVEDPRISPVIDVFYDCFQKFKSQH